MLSRPKPPPAAAHYFASVTVAIPFMSKKLGPNKSWNGDGEDGFSRRQSNAHKRSIINYPGLKYDDPHAPITSPPATAPTHAAPGPSRAQYPSLSASMPPRAVSAPAAFSPQVVGSYPLPSVSPQPPTVALPTRIASAAPRHHTQPPRNIAIVPQPEPHKTGKWCWVHLSDGWTWAWVPNTDPRTLGIVPVAADAHRWSRNPPMTLWSNVGGDLVVTPPSTEDCRLYVVKAVTENGHWYWVEAWVPRFPPGKTPSHSAVQWASRGPPPL